jgi:hypothetical protein
MGSKKEENGKYLVVRKEKKSNQSKILHNG